MLPNKKGNDAKKFSLLLPNIILKKKICRISIPISARKRSDYIWFTLAGTYLEHLKNVEIFWKVLMHFAKFQMQYSG